MLGRKPAKRDGPLYLFLHIPKSAGSSIEHHVRETFTGGGSVTLNFKADTKHEVWGNLVRSRPRPELLVALMGHRVFYGLHEICPDRSARYFTFLRSPVDRVVSLYNFWADKPERRGLMFRDDELISFADFVETPAAQNNSLRFLAHAFEGDRAPGAGIEHPSPSHLDAAKRFLDLCWFVGFVEEFDEDYSYLASEMGMPPRSEVRNISTAHLDRAVIADAEQRILELNAADVEVYEYARSLRGR